MTERKKAVDDPLSDLFGDNDISSKKSIFDDPVIEKKKLPEVIEPRIEETIFREIDASKIKLNDKKSKKQSDNANSSSHTAIASHLGLGRNLNLWDNQTKPKQSLDSLFDDSPSTFSNDDGGLFSSPSKVKDLNSVLTNSQTASNNLRVYAEDDDDDIENLKVSKLLQREEEADFETFGNSSNASRSKSKTSAKVKYAKEDLDISTFDKVSNLEQGIEEDELSKYLASLNSSTVTKKKDSSTFDLNNSDAAEIDISSLDLNDYIAKQQSNSGGLFD